MSRSLRQKGRCNKIDQEDKHKQHFIGLIANEIFVEEQQTSFSVFFSTCIAGSNKLLWSQAGFQFWSQNPKNSKFSYLWELSFIFAFDNLKAKDWPTKGGEHQLENEIRLQGRSSNESPNRETERGSEWWLQKHWTDDKIMYFVRTWAMSSKVLRLSILSRILADWSSFCCTWNNYI